MGKPSLEVYQRFSKKYDFINKQLNKKQYLVPYLMSSHPGSRLKDAIALAEFLRDNHLNPEQVQDFYPTPGSISTCMYYIELDPRDMKPVYVPKTYEEKQMQRALLQYKRPENYHLVYHALKKADRLDLAGNSPKCLIPYKKGATNNGKNFERKTGLRKSQGRNETRGEKTGRSRNNARSGSRHRGR
jgi:radical SAM superfamily enzyme YgiQ (UPF0313 family)